MVGLPKRKEAQISLLLYIYLLNYHEIVKEKQCQNIKRVGLKNIKTIRSQ